MILVVKSAGSTATCDLWRKPSAGKASAGKHRTNGKPDKKCNKKEAQGSIREFHCETKSYLSVKSLFSKRIFFLTSHLTGTLPDMLQCLWMRWHDHYRSRSSFTLSLLDDICRNKRKPWLCNKGISSSIRLITVRIRGNQRKYWAKKNEIKKTYL